MDWGGVWHSPGKTTGIRNEICWVLDVLEDVGRLFDGISIHLPGAWAPSSCGSAEPAAPNTFAWSGGRHDCYLLLRIATYCYCMSHDFPLSCWNHADPRCVLGLSLHRPNSLASNCPIHSCYFLLQQWRTLHQISWARGGTVLICITLLVDTATLLPGICRSSSQLSWAPPYIVLLCKAMSISSKLCGFVAFCSGALHSGGILTWISSTIFFYVYLYNIIE